MNKALIRKMLWAVLLVSAATAHAKDLGVQAKVWEIGERDMRELVMESAGHVDWNGIRNQLKGSGENYLDRLPVRHFAEAARTETTFIDPSIMLTGDIQIPVKSGNTYKMTPVYKKGTTINPLARYRPVTAMLFFDGNDEDQVKFAKAVVDASANRVVPISLQGKPIKKLTETFGRPVFYATDAMLSRFPVKASPSLLYPGSGKHELELAMTAFARPFKPAEAAALWPPKNNAGGVNVNTR